MGWGPVEEAGGATRGSGLVLEWAAGIAVAGWRSAFTGEELGQAEGRDSGGLCRSSERLAEAVGRPRPPPPPPPAGGARGCWRIHVM